ncbi:MAG: DUF4837 family protein [Bacteroidetes bacterium]|nr:DUF4837 family protein [Bacteroidota bacterium]
MVSRFSVVLTVLLLTGLIGCGISTKDEAIGESDVITIIADSSDYDALYDVIENAFGKPFFTPQPETWFTWQRYNLSALLEHKRDRNILILSPLDADHRLGEYMRSALDSTVQELVEQGEQHVFVRKNLWYRGQVVVHLTGRTLPELRDFMASNAGRLEYYFKQAWDEREMTRMRKLPREEEIENDLLERYGFGFTIIKSWFVAKDSSEINTVLLRRQAPTETERWLMVHWLDTTNTSLLTNDFAYETRNRLTEMLYRTYDDSSWVVIDSVHHLQFDEVNFQDRFAIMMRGLWRMNDYSMGGPFISYLFYDDEQERIYFIEGSIFAPRYEKKKLIQDMDVMIKTLRLTNPNDGKSAS